MFESLHFTLLLPIIILATNFSLLQVTPYQLHTGASESQLSFFFQPSPTEICYDYEKLIKSDMHPLCSALPWRFFLLLDHVQSVTAQRIFLTSAIIVKSIQTIPLLIVQTFMWFAAAEKKDDKTIGLRWMKHKMRKVVYAKTRTYDCQNMELVPGFHMVCMLSMVHHFHLSLTFRLD